MTPLPPASPAVLDLVAVPAPRSSLAGPAAPAAPSRWQPSFASPVVGPWVLATAVSGEQVWVGGDFTYGTAGRPGGTYDRIAHWDGTGWQQLGGGLDGPVRAIAVVGTDVYVGGDFTSADGVPAPHLARWDGSAWSAVGGGVTQPEADYGTTVLALASDGTRLYVGGTFSRAGSTPVRSLAALTLATGTWSDLGGGAYRAASSDVPDPGTVSALVLHGSSLHVGGRFDRISDLATCSFATLDTATGAWRGYGPGVRDEDSKGTVDAVAVDPDSGALYVGGSFTRAGDAEAWNVARLDGSTFSSLGRVASYGGKYAEVHALAVSGGQLHLGGSFTSVGPLEAEHWVVLDDGTWRVPGAPLDNVVRTLTACPAGVLVGGDFDDVGDLRVQHLGVWTGSAWRLLGQGPHSGYFSGGEVNALVPQGDGVVAGGLFDQAGGVRLGSVGRWTGRTWDPMAGGVTAAVGHGQVFAMAALGDDLYVAGSFDRAGDVAARNVARWDGERWSPLGPGCDSGVQALAVLGGRLYAGGSFSTAGGLLVGGLACWDPDAQRWSPVGGGPLYDHTVNALAVIGDRYLVVGGWFDGFHVGGAKLVEGLHGLTMFDTARALDPADPLSGYLVLPGVSRYGAAGWVRALEVVGGDLFVGGWFDRAGVLRAASPQGEGFAASNLAVWHFATSGEWATAGDPDHQVYGLEAVDDDLVAAGWFGTVGGTPASRIARLDRARGTWSPLGEGLRAASDDHVEGRALASSPAGLWVGGSFTCAGPVPSNNLACWAPSGPEVPVAVGPGT
jgi:hypothetical protein